jgi:hypothetical protein
MLPLSVLPAVAQQPPPTAATGQKESPEAERRNEAAVILGATFESESDTFFTLGGEYSSSADGTRSGQACPLTSFTSTTTGHTPSYLE